MNEPIQRCPHSDARGCISKCDCGRQIFACYECLASGEILACGQCDIAEATNRTDFSIAVAREAAQIFIQLLDMGGDFQDEVIMHRFLESRVKNEDCEGEEWKGEDR